MRRPHGFTGSNVLIYSWFVIIISQCNWAIFIIGLTAGQVASSKIQNDDHVDIVFLIFVHIQNCPRPFATHTDFTALNIRCRLRFLIQRRGGGTEPRKLPVIWLFLPGCRCPCVMTFICFCSWNPHKFRQIRFFISGSVVVATSTAT